VARPRGPKFDEVIINHLPNIAQGIIAAEAIIEIF